MKYITAIITGAAAGAAVFIAVLILIAPKEKDLAEFYRMVGEG